MKDWQIVALGLVVFLALQKRQAPPPPAQPAPTPGNMLDDLLALGRQAVNALVPPATFGDETAQDESYLLRNEDGSLA